MARPLTARQQQVYDFIHDRISTRGYGPTVREIGEFLGIRSPNGVMCHLRALERKGMISRLANKSRAIELTNRAQGDGSSSPLSVEAALAVHGSVAKGQCSLFDAPKPFDLLEVLQRTERYLLQVNGSELRQYAIEDGDMLVIEPSCSSQQENLELVRSAAGSIELQMPGNHEANEAAKEVVGVVVGVLRLHHSGSKVKPPHLLTRRAQLA